MAEHDERGQVHARGNPPQAHAEGQGLRRGAPEVPGFRRSVQGRRLQDPPRLQVPTQDIQGMA